MGSSRDRKSRSRSRDKDKTRSRSRSRDKGKRRSSRSTGGAPDLSALRGVGQVTSNARHPWLPPGDGIVILAKHSLKPNPEKNNALVYRADFIIIDVISTSGTTKKDTKLKVAGTYAYYTDPLMGGKGGQNLFQKNVKGVLQPAYESAKSKKATRTISCPPDKIDQAYIQKLFWGKRGEPLDGSELVGAVLRYSGRRSNGKQFVNKDFEPLPRAEILNYPEFFAKAPTSLIKTYFSDLLDEKTLAKLRKRGRKMEDEEEDESVDEDTSEEESEDDSESESEEESDSESESEDDSESDSEDESEDDSESDSDSESEDDSESDSEDESEDDSDSESEPPKKRRKKPAAKKPSSRSRKKPAAKKKPLKKRRR